MGCLPDGLDLFAGESGPVAVWVFPEGEWWWPGLVFEVPPGAVFAESGRCAGFGVVGDPDEGKVDVSRVAAAELGEEGDER